MLSRVANALGSPLDSAPEPAQAPAPEAAPEPIQGLDPEDSDLTEIPDPDEPAPTPEQPFDGLELEVAGESKRLTREEIKTALEEHRTIKQTSEAINLQRSAIEQERAAIQQIRMYAPAVERIQAEAGFLAQHMQRLDQEIASLRESDPVAAFQKREEFNAFAQRYQQLGGMAQQASEQLRMAELQRLDAEVKAELPALMQKLPQWKDAEKRKSDQSFIREYMKREGYSDHEANLATKSHYVVTLLKAAKYDAISKARASKKVNTAPPMARAGSPQMTPGTQAALERSQYKKAIKSATTDQQKAKLVQKRLESLL